MGIDESDLRLRDSSEIACFGDPFCPEAEVQYWLDLTNLLEIQMRHEDVPQACCARLLHDSDIDNTFPVIWKRPDFQAPTGIILDGEWAGYFVQRFDNYNGIARVTLGRAISRYNALFNRELAKTHVKRIHIEDGQKQAIFDELRVDTLDYPKMINMFLKWLGYPVNSPILLDNIRRANVLWGSL
jgi:hypothetical protein